MAPQPGPARPATRATAHQPEPTGFQDRDECSKPRCPASFPARLARMPACWLPSARRGGQPTYPHPAAVRIPAMDRGSLRQPVHRTDWQSAVPQRAGLRQQAWPGMLQAHSATRKGQAERSRELQGVVELRPQRAPRGNESRRTIGSPEQPSQQRFHKGLACRFPPVFRLRCPAQSCAACGFRRRRRRRGPACVSAAMGCGRPSCRSSSSRITASRPSGVAISAALCRAASG